MQKFRKLKIWNKSIDFVSEIYKLTNTFPNHELYGLSSQLRRAAVSISLNIAEGSGSDSDIEFKRFLNIALKSCYEVMSGLEISLKLEYCENKQVNKLLIELDELSAMISGFIKKLRAESC